MDKNPPFKASTTNPMPRPARPRLAALRAELANTRGLDGFLVPRADEHQGEYVPKRAERLAWLTAFTGSAGAAVVLKDKAAVFVDGRYTLQVRQQTDTKLFEPRDLVGEGPAPGSQRTRRRARARLRPLAAYGGRRRHAAHRRRRRPAPNSSPATAIRSMRCGPISPGRRWRKPCRMRSSSPAKARKSKRMRIAEDMKKLGADAA